MAVDGVVAELLQDDVGRLEVTRLHTHVQRGHVDFFSAKSLQERNFKETFVYHLLSV